MKTWHWRAVLYGSILIGCFLAIWPPYARNGKPGRINLGLDLRGGTYLVLQVMTDDVAVGAQPRVPPETMKEVMRVLERRVNQFGATDPVISEYGRTGDQVLVQLPGLTDVEQAKRLLVGVAQLSLHLVEDVGPTREALLRSSQGRVPPDLRILEGQGDSRESALYLVHRLPVVTGRDLRTARAGVGDQGEPTVQFRLNPQGAERFEQETRRNIGRRLAIVLDERVVSAPVIEQAIRGEGQIRGRFTAAQADELAKLLRAGALPAKMRYLHQFTVGASLGRDSIRAGIVASAAATVGVAAFMVAYYRFSGLNALLALGANLLVLLAAMACTGAPLTLPGIAGVVLTLGIGVDTNVLVFERIREELRNGKTVRAAIRNGFDRVWITILDTHATALIAAAILFQFGTGPIRGFAVTLVMGLVANVFASYSLSKLLFDWGLRRREVSRLSI